MLGITESERIKRYQESWGRKKKQRHFQVSWFLNLEFELTLPTNSSPKGLLSVKIHNSLCSEKSMLRHPQSISVAICCIREKVACYFFASYHPSTILSHPLCWESSQYTWNCTEVKTSRKSSTFTTFTMWSYCMKGKPSVLVHSWLLCWSIFGNYCRGNNFKLPHILRSCVCWLWFWGFCFVFFSPACLLAKSEQRIGSTEKWSLMHSGTTRERRGSNCMDKFEMPGRAQSSQWKRASNEAKSKENAVHCPSE